MLTRLADNAYTMHVMATDKTGTLRVRIPNDVIESLEADAASLGLAPGTLARRILEGRYSLRGNVGKTHDHTRKTDVESEPRAEGVFDG